MRYWTWLPIRQCQIPWECLLPEDCLIESGSKDLTWFELDNVKNDHKDIDNAFGPFEIDMEAEGLTAGLHWLRFSLKDNQQLC